MGREDNMEIDIDRLRDDLREESYGAFFVGGFGGAMFEAMDIDRASDEEIIRMALKKGFDIEDYCE